MTSVDDTELKRRCQKKMGWLPENEVENLRPEVIEMEWNTTGKQGRRECRGKKGVTAVYRECKAALAQIHVHV